MLGTISSCIKELLIKCLRVIPGNSKLIRGVFVFSSCLSFILIYQSYNENHVSMKKCKLPRLDPFDKTLDPYRGIPKYEHCSNQSSLMYVDLNGYLQINESAVLKYSLNNMSCMYHKLQKVEGDKAIKVDDGINFMPPVFIQSRIFRVVCKTETGGKVYDFIHVNMAWNESRIKEKQIRYESDSELSVIFIGLDSISRSGAIRTLPKSFQYLTETLGAYDFQGYTKIGMNSWPNIMTLLTGGFHHKFFLTSVFRHTFVDKIPFLWNEPKMDNWATFFSEDRLATFSEPMPGFNKQPTDYYYRPVVLAMEEFEPVILKPLGSSNIHCYGNKDHASLQIIFLKEFISKYTGKLKFAFLWRNGANHDINNYNFWDDKPLYELLRWLKSNGHLERAVLVVGSDHGSRTSGIASTHIGRIENNLPFLTLYVPDVLKRRYPWLHENLKYNTRQLTSPYDLHKTMRDVINAKYFKRSSDINLGLSLFAPVPEDRTCNQAGIPAQYCTCYEEISIDRSSLIAINLAKFAVDHLNFMLGSYRNVCQELFLHNVTLAKVVYSAEGDADRVLIKRNPSFFQRIFGKWENDESGRYIIVLFTKPNNGLTEFMIEYEKHPSHGRHKTMSVVGNPSRLNRYGNQSHCIKDKTLKQFCLCNDIYVTE